MDKKVRDLLMFPVMVPILSVKDYPSEIDAYTDRDADECPECMAELEGLCADVCTVCGWKEFD